MIRLLAPLLALALCAPARAQQIDASPTAQQLPGTATNDSANTGNLGEYLSATCPRGSATITVTIAAPAVVTDTAHGIVTGCPVYFTNSGGALPTGIVANTTYFAVKIDANTFNIASTIANALTGSVITTTGSQSGTQTGVTGYKLSTGTTADIAGISLTAGDWDCSGTMIPTPNGATTTSLLQAWLSTTSVTAPNAANGGFVVNQTALGAGLTLTLITMPVRFSLSATTTVFLSGSATFATNIMDAGASIRCRRAR